MLSAKNVSFEYNNAQVLNGTSFSVSESDKIALIGPNGVGKSTLLKILAGKLKSTEGSVNQPNDLYVGYMPQEIDEYGNLTAAEFLKEVTGVTDALKVLEGATSDYSLDQSKPVLAAYESAYEKVEALQAFSFDEMVNKPLSRVGLTNEVLSMKVNNLSGGQKTKLALAAILLSRFNVLLLDEPTNNLDMQGLQILEDFLSKSKSAFVVVSHDRSFIRKATNKIAELLPSGKIKIYSLGYEEYLDSRSKERESATQAYRNYTEEKKRLEESARKKANQARSAAYNSGSSDNDKMNANARKEKAAGAHAKAASALISRLEQLEEPERPGKEIDLNFRFTESESKIPAVAAKLTGAVVDFSPIKMGPYDLTVNTGDKIVIIGPNGGGKSTLMRLIAAKLVPSEGSIEVTDAIKIGYLDQNFTFPFLDRSVLQNIKPSSASETSELYNLLAKFGIKKDKADSLPSELSPGQRARALLASLVAKGTNLILLDEPTNHLDIPASEELQQALADYHGTLLVISHDRELINALNPKRIVVVDKGSVLDEKHAQEYINLSQLNRS
jgi:ATPase subunit of ABC transporter with duplicated ATPase domains